MRYLLFIGIIIWLLGCSPGNSPTTDPPTPIAPVSFDVPKGFPPIRYALDRNPITTDGIALGRMLFYDARLSRDSTISCAECHNQAYSFTHHGHDLSHGINNRLGTRNSLPLQNLAWNPYFFWDGGVTDLDLFPVAPIQDHNEMDNTMSNVISTLKRDKNYPQRFKAAFGTTEITSARMLQALSQFMLSLVSANSRYDKYVRGEAGGTLTVDELAGKALFTQKGCVKCHAGKLFTDYSFRNNGLSLAYNQDVGRAKITELAQDRFTFRVPSLRNVERTFPYMHDGRFTTLEAVMKHYAGGLYATPNLDPLLNQNGQLGIPLTDTEQAQLIAFLKTLTDPTFITDPRFAAP